MLFYLKQRVTDASWRHDGNAAHGGSKMIPNEILAAWMVAATTGVAALGGLSLLDSRSWTWSVSPVGERVELT
jgi:hypothetical protein